MKPEKARDALTYAACAAATAVLAFMTTSRVIDHAHGLAVPLDDAYIHFQYARSFASGHPFRYTPGAIATPGATSLLWPFVLSPFYLLGFRGDRIIWAAWFIGWASLALLACETRRLAEGLVRPSVAISTCALVLSFGGFTWFAASGMEVIPFAWLLTRTARRASEWLETRDGESGASPMARRRYTELVALSCLCPLMRPEGVLGSIMVVVALLVRRQGAPYRALPAAAGPFVPSLVCLAFTGHAVTSTALAKWLPLNPYYRGAPLVYAVLGHLQILFGTLMNGELWTSVFLPEGGRVVLWLALAAPIALGIVRGRKWRAGAVVLLASGMMIPTTYETFLVNRVRYIWPFAPGLMVGVASLAELVGVAVGSVAGRFGQRVSWIPLGLVGLAAALLLTRLSPSMEDLATSSEAVTLQQVSLGKWAGTSLPRDAKIGVNDTGAIAYFSSRTTFDVVGLTTAGEAKYWAAGAGSRFEHYEKLPPESRPGYFIVYPEWMAVDPVLGDMLTRRTVHHTILGGATMAAFTARYDLLGSGEAPLEPSLRARRLVDALDVADLESENDHRYQLLDATKANDVVVETAEYADGARKERYLDKFRLRLAPGGTLVARLEADAGSSVSFRVDGAELSRAELDRGLVQEVTIGLPRDLTEGSHDIEVEGNGSRATFDSLHYWAFQ